MSDSQTPVVILGSGGYAHVVAQILQQEKSVHVLGCTDKMLGLSERVRDEIGKLPILGDDDILPDLANNNQGLHAVLGLGPTLIDVRARLILTLHEQAIPAIAAIHPHSFVAQSSQIGQGTVIRAGGLVGPDTTIGDHCVLGMAASIDHRSTLGKNVFVGQGARISSYVTIADNVMIEMGASVNSRVKIGRNARITSGAFVNTDVPERAVVSGVPGRVVRYQTR